MDGENNGLFLHSPCKVLLRLSGNKKMKCFVKDSCKMVLMAFVLTNWISLSHLQRWWRFLNLLDTP